jgi:molybdenum cofactor biosynthesis enzyme MoaA
MSSTGSGALGNGSGITENTGAAINRVRMTRNRFFMGCLANFKATELKMAQHSVQGIQSELQQLRQSGDIKTDQ